MLLTCENCQTIFRVDAKAIAPQGNGSAVRSVNMSGGLNLESLLKNRRQDC